MKIVRILGEICSVLVLVIVVAILISFSIPRIMGYTPYTIITGSMEPSYHVGSMVYVKKVNFQDIEVGESVTFNRGDKIITHRVIEINVDNKEVITKGDANNASDGSISYSNIIGKTSKLSIPYLGYLTIFLNNWSGKLLFLVMLGGIAVIGNILKSISVEKQSEG